MSNAAIATIDAFREASGRDDIYPATRLEDTGLDSLELLAVFAELGIDPASDLDTVSDIIARVEDQC